MAALRLGQAWRVQNQVKYETAVYNPCEEQGCTMKRISTEIFSLSKTPLEESNK
jgi:hypothetical protein